jgi:putative tryptophan/tyrosine transport system substrate-binding protein
MPTMSPASTTAEFSRGDKPADLPVQQATKIELLFNFKTAKTLDLNLPLSMQGRADEVIKLTPDFR